MRRLLVPLALTVIFFACKKNGNDAPAANELIGRYKGSFTRTGMDTAKVNFTFNSDMSFEGTGGASNYPAICGGTFQRNSNSLVVNDTCTWTANFDWTLIFDGDYNISFTGESSVRIWRTNGAVTDEYLLSRIASR